ncbi:MAG: T9SS type A sorting domain-containing protein [Fimbriimonadaceae bacterium]|nr:T9SS type A sorting domain-containing protein [Chitinophagales bacterium]
MELQKKKLTAYSTLAITFMAISSDADAQVIYTDIDPDIILTENGDRTGIDIDNDGTNNLLFKKNNIDASFTYPYGEYTLNIQYGLKFTRAEPAPGNSLLATYGSYGYAYPSVLNAGDLIDGKQNWLSVTSQIMGRNIIIDFTSESGFSYQLNYLYGYWEAETTDKYLGVKININDNTFYGWARLDITEGSESLIIKDYAINLVPGASIEAGQMEGPDVIQSLNDNTVSAYSFENTIYVNIANQIQNIIPVKIFNTSGQVIFSTEIKNGKTIIPLVNVAAGIYTLQLQGADGVYTKKINLN